MSTPVHEIVIFGLKPGVDRAAFVAAIPESEAFLRRQEGFISRTILPEVDGARWVDLVLWESAEAAHAAFERFGQELGSCLFAQAIDDASVVALRARV